MRFVSIGLRKTVRLGGMEERGRRKGRGAYMRSE
jgi:hypothetical protein